MGMFDSVIGKCPHCGEKVEMQSKAGVCNMEEYNIRQVPVVIAEDLNKTKAKYNTTCEHCSKRFTLEALSLPKFVSCVFVPLDDEDEEED